MSKRFSDLMPGTSLCMMFLNPITYELQGLVGCIVDSIGHSGSILGVRLPDPDEQGKAIITYFRVNPDSYVNDSLLDYREHRMHALFETKEDAIGKYIEFCESKIEEFKENIEKVGHKFIGI